MAIDERRVDAAQRLVAQADPLGCGGAHRVDQDIAACGQAVQHVSRLGLFHVEDDAALVAVAGQEHRTHVARMAWTYRACEVTVGRFDFDHIGAHVAQVLRGDRPHDHRSQVQHLDAVQRPWLGTHAESPLDRLCSPANPNR